MRTKIGVAFAATTLVLAGCSTDGGGGAKAASSGGGADASGVAAEFSATAGFEEFRKKIVGATEGRTLAYVPGGMGNDAQTTWAADMEQGAKALGMDFILRDPAWDRNKQVQATETLINQLDEGDVLVLNPQDVSLLSSLVEKAAGEGIYTIILNQESSYLGDVYVGGDQIDIGRRTAEDLVEACGEGTSKKVAIIEGDSTGGISVNMKRGAKPVFAANPDIKIVSEQNGSWDPKKSYDITSVVLQQHPDLCGLWVQWDPMALAAGNAIADAGKKGQVKVFTYDAVAACKSIQQGLVTASYADSRTEQGDLIVGYAAMLIQSGVQPGAMHTGYLSRTVKIDGTNAGQPGLCYGKDA